MAFSKTVAPSCCNFSDQTTYVTPTPAHDALGLAIDCIQLADIHLWDSSYVTASKYHLQRLDKYRLFDARLRKFPVLVLNHPDKRDFELLA